LNRGPKDEIRFINSFRMQFWKSSNFRICSACTTCNLLVLNRRPKSSNSGPWCGSYKLILLQKQPSIPTPMLYYPYPKISRQYSFVWMLGTQPSGIQPESF